ncbi:g6f-like isoform X2 [Toxotes jaculatrix]|uniref:g6f-like isoform X2 n=1 Tax=Toxotes jaculatrix TaxID=941984 RepID=UPI001B3AC36E|nr:g6f-like isoform X2 [Toxotes jaculatrix]
MDSGFLTFILVSSFAAYPSHLTGWDNVVVAREGMSTTLVCTDTTVRGAVAINWMVKSHDKNDWKLVLSASEGKEFSGGASKASMRLTDPNFQDTGVFSLSFAPNKEDSGLYSCLIKQQEKQLKTRIILLAVLTDPMIATATLAQTSFTLTCPGVQGDYVMLYWGSPDNKKHVKLVHQYDRWRGSTLVTTQSKKLQLAGRPYNAEAGSFSFLLTPGIKDGGLYICEVFLNDNAYSQRTLLSVLKVKTNHSPSKLELSCQYSERSHVQSAIWKYQNKSRRLRMSSSSPGTITITVPLPITSDTAGNYTCTLKLKNGQTIWATQAVTLPPEDGRDESVSVTATSLLPSLSALLLLVPLVAAAVGVLLWRQKHISDRGIEQSLSIQSSEAENIYENPEDIRQTPPQGSVYMDLKPRGEDDVYKELERSEQCQS